MRLSLSELLKTEWVGDEVFVLASDYDAALRTLAEVRALAYSPHAGVAWKDIAQEMASRADRVSLFLDAFANLVASGMSVQVPDEQIPESGVFTVLAKAKHCREFNAAMERALRADIPPNYAKERADKAEAQRDAATQRAEQAERERDALRDRINWRFDPVHASMLYTASVEASPIYRTVIMLAYEALKPALPAPATNATGEP